MEKNYNMEGLDWTLSSIICINVFTRNVFTSSCFNCFMRISYVAILELKIKYVIEKQNLNRKKKKTDIETFLFGKKVGLAPKYLPMKKTQTLKILSF